MKKILSVVLAMTLALSVFAVCVSAEQTPIITLTANKEIAAVGDVVTFTVSVCENSKLCNLKAILLYDTASYELVSAVAGKDGFGAGAAINANKAGRVTYAAANAMSIADSAAVLFTVELKVLKVNGEVTLAIDEAYKAGANNAEVNILDEVQAGITPVKVACSHANKTEYVITKPDCENAGLKTEMCDDCEYESEKVTIPALGHKYGEADVKLEPTCLTPGYSVSICEVCQQENKEVISALGHKYSESQIVQDPTCSKEGIERQWCIECNFPHDTPIAKLPHTEGEWEVVTEATETEPGKRVKKCTVCGEVIAEEEIPVTPVYMIGDVDGSGKVSAIDVRHILQYVAELREFDDAQFKAADVDKSGTVTSMDARLILQYLAELKDLPTE